MRVTTVFYTSMWVNVEALYELIHTLAPNMIKRGYGRIVNVYSGWGAFSDGLTRPGAYSISKATLNALTVSFSHALPNTVKVNAVCPGWVSTQMGGPLATRSPDEGAATALWLATLECEGPTGGFFRDKKRIAW